MLGQKLSQPLGATCEELAVATFDYFGGSEVVAMAFCPACDDLLDVVGAGERSMAERPPPDE